jgi:hypothetical protein
MKRTLAPLLAFLIVFLAVAPVAYAVTRTCRVRRPPTIVVTGVPKVCDEAFKADVAVRGYPAVRSVEVRLDGRVVRRSNGDVRVPCDRLAEGRHVLDVIAANSNDTRNRSYAFQRD